MKSLPSLFLISFAVILMLSNCESSTQKTSSTKRISLNPSYQKFQNLVSVANCIGPKRKYTTEVRSTNKEYTYFKQSYENPENNYEAVISNLNKGFQVTANKEIIDTLSIQSIEIIRSHEFHKLHMFPSNYFRNLQFKENLVYQAQDCEVFVGQDRFNTIAKVFYNRNKELIEGFQFQNPSDTTEQIEVRYTAWMDSKLGPIAKKIEIIQGGKYTYYFDYEHVLINDSEFKKH